MNYDEFKAAFLQSLHHAGLPTLGPAPHEELLDLRSTSRKITVFVEPVARDVGAPFHIGGRISWSWDSLQSARTATTEEDLLSELLGQEVAEQVDSEQPWLRIDIRLSASLMVGKSVAMPSAEVWTKWSREAIGRLERIEPLVADEMVREDAEGRLAVLGWQGEPEIRATCNNLGELRLESIRVSAFQCLDLPRRWDDQSRAGDEPPYQQLDEMFARIKVALHAWGEVMDHLR